MFQAFMRRLSGLKRTGRAVLPLVLLVSACGTSGGVAAPSAVTRSVTSTVTSSVFTTVTETNTATETATVTVSAQPVVSPAAPSSSADPGASIDACSLLTHAEAEKLAQTPLMKAIQAGETSAGGFVACQITGPTTGPTAQVEIYVGDGALQQLQIDRDKLKHTFTTVPGIGDRCLQEDGFIFVQKNGLWASIHLVRFNDARQNIPLMQAAIRELSARLP